MNQSVTVSFHKIINLQINWDNVSSLITQINILPESDDSFTAMPIVPESISYTIDFLTNYYHQDKPAYLFRYLDFGSISPFYKRVYEALSKIPMGSTTSYGSLAKAAGSPKAFRAVGSAMNRNPFPIIVPCHRVLAKNGIGGFASGISNKERLLSKESINLAL